jgi:hypothetical protein
MEILAQWGLAEQRYFAATDPAQKRACHVELHKLREEYLEVGRTGTSGEPATFPGAMPDESADSQP